MFQLHAIGRVESPLRDPAAAPKQGEEGSPLAELVFDPAVKDALGDVRVGDRLLLLTWLDRADRSILRVHPRDNPDIPLCGVFSTRSADRRLVSSPWSKSSAIVVDQPAIAAPPWTKRSARSHGIEWIPR